MVKETNKSIVTDFYKTSYLAFFTTLTKPVKPDYIANCGWWEVPSPTSQKGGGGITLLKQRYPPQFFITAFINGLSHHSMAT